jgi:CarD family transcriptional regulator
MELSVGDQVVHPKFGAGEITGVEQLELVEGFDNYYVIAIGDRGLVLRVPIRKMEELGVRPVMTPSRLDRVLETLRSTPARLSTDFKTRQARIKEKLKTGRPLKIAEVVRDLTWHKRQSHLSPTDTRLLNQGQEVLATEIALVTDTKLFEARQMIDTALTDTVNSEGDAPEPAQQQEQSYCPTTGQPVKQNELEHFTMLDKQLIWWRCPACQGMHISRSDQKAPK